MKLSLIKSSATFSVAELSSMELDAEIFRYYEVFALFGFIETAETRAEYLKVAKTKKARKRTHTEIWVRDGGILPSHLELVDLR